MEFVTLFPYQICGHHHEVGGHRTSLHRHVVVQVTITPFRVVVVVVVIIVCCLLCIIITRIMLHYRLFALNHSQHDICRCESP
jgi:uncharacterized membrane protein YdfJ with MMPL/SSD domain